MKTDNVAINRFRVRSGACRSNDSFGNNGAFEVPWRIGILRVIVSDGAGWDHVSVSLPNRCPTHEEMRFVKLLFFRDDETVMELHVPEDQHLNCHPFCLHLWRPQDQTIPRPPSWMVGPSTNYKEPDHE